jgi:hypothetical protein
MSALSRLRSPAAALALLLFLSANAAAWTDKPMDNPEGPPIPKPQEVGEPDFGNGLTWNRIMHLFRASFVSHPLLKRIALPVNRTRMVRTGLSITAQRRR